MMTEADKVSELHQEVKNNLLNEDLEKVKNWQKDAYHKQIMGGFKETKEAEDGFRKAQKPWAKKMKEVPRGWLPWMGQGRAGELRGPVSSEGGCLQAGWRCTALWDCVPEGRDCLPGRRIHRWAGTAVLTRSVSWGGRQCRAGKHPQVGGHCSQIPGARACVPSAS